MKGLYVALALAGVAFVNTAAADDYNTWPTSPAAKCLMDRGDSNSARFAAADSNCGPVGDTTRAPRAYVLANDVETLIRAIRLGDPQGVKTLTTALWRTQNRSPALSSCWKAMVQTCNATNIGAAVEAAKPATP